MMVPEMPPMRQMISQAMVMGVQAPEARTWLPKPTEPAERQVTMASNRSRPLAAATSTAK